MKHYALPLIAFVMCLMLALPCAALAAEADAYGAPALKLGESGTEDGYSDRIPVYEDKLDSKTKVWNKVNNPKIRGDEYTVSLIEGVTVAKDPAGSLLYQGDDAGAAINSAVTAAKGKGGTVLLAAGDYEVKTTIELDHGIALWGIDRPVLKNTAAPIVINLAQGVSGVTICNLIIDGGRGVCDAFGIECADYTSNVTIMDVYLHDVEQHGISFRGSESKHHKVLRCKVVDCAQGAGIGFYTTANTSLVQDCYVLRTRYHSIIVSYGGSNMRIVDNTVVESGYYADPENVGHYAHGIALDGSYGRVHGHNHLIQGNMIKDAGRAGIEVGDGQSDVIITGNVIEGTGRSKKELDTYGIYFGGSNCESVNATITYNTITDTNAAGIRVTASVDMPFCENVLVAYNDISNAGQDGILVQRANHVTVTHNRVVDSGCVIKNSQGIAVKGMEDMASDLIITDNICTDTRKKPRQEFGLFILNGRNVLVAGNEFSGNGEGDWFELNCENLHVIDP